MIPVAGAQYHWTWHMAPKRVKMFATWIQGWTTWFGYVALQAALANILVVQLESLITLNSETYVAGGWKTSVLVIACATFQGLVNVYAFRIIPWLEMISSILHVGLFVLVLVVFVVMAPKHEARFLLQPMIASGWDHNPYVSWHLGMLTCIFSITGTPASLTKTLITSFADVPSNQVSTVSFICPKRPDGQSLQSRGPWSGPLPLTGRLP